MRKLASIQRIEEVKPIEGADAIDAYRVLGWWVVDKKGAHKVGDLVVYFEIDSWIPHELAPFLSKGNEPREYNGVKGEKLRTIKLRGTTSQGLILQKSVLDRFGTHFVNATNNIPERWVSDDYNVVELMEGYDLTEILDIQKWEAPISPQLQGKAAGTFPTSLIPKTNQERSQNIFGVIQKKAGRFSTEKVWNAETQTLEETPVILPEGFKEPTYEVTLKLDGSSCTIFRWEDKLRVCSRNMELIIDEENKDNSFVAMALKIGDKIPNGFAFQGELMGPGIQGNREGFTEHKFFVFDIFNIQEYAYLNPYNRQLECKQRGLDHVPVLANDWVAPESVADALAIAEGPSINHRIREGLVWKCNEDPNFSFKIISNHFLLKEAS